MADEAPTADAKTEEESVSMVEFLENRPPGSMFKIPDLMVKETYQSGGFNWWLNVPPLHLYCDSAESPRA